MAKCCLGWLHTPFRRLKTQVTEYVFFDKRKTIFKNERKNSSKCFEITAKMNKWEEESATENRARDRVHTD